MRPRVFTPALVALIALLPAALPATASAETPTGDPVITIPLGKSGSGLRAKGVKVTAFGGGVIRSGSVGLLVNDISVGSASRINLVLSGGVKLKTKKRSLTVKGFFVQVTSRHVNVTAKVGSKRIRVIEGKLDSAAQFDIARIAASFAAGKATLTRTAVKSIRSKLRHFSPRSRSIGRLAGNVFVVTPPQTGAVTPPTTAYSCLPVSGPASGPSKPATAVDISCGFVVFNTRDSWTKYIELNTPIEPASGLPAYDGKNHVCPDAGTPGFVDAYSFSLPVTSGWWDAASGTGYIASAGGVHYQSGARGIDITIKDLEISIDGASSMTYVTATSSDDPTPKRFAFASFNPAAPLAGQQPEPGVSLSRLKLTLTDESLTGLFGSMYDPPVGFGCVDMGFNF